VGPRRAALLLAVLGASTAALGGGAATLASGSTSTGWTAPVRVDVAATTTQPVSGLSCAGGFCLAVDSAGRTFTWSGSWRRRPGIGRSVGFVSGVSCASSSFCVAVANRSSQSASTSYAVTWTGAGWSAPVTLYGASGGAAEYERVQAVSCTSRSFCIAVGAQVGSEVFNGSRWSARPGRTSGTDGQGSLGCSSPSFCVNFHDGDANYWDGSAWRFTAANSGLSAGAVPGLDDFVYGVSCVSSAFCAAGDLAAAPLLWNGRAWRASRVEPPGSGGFGSVSCTSTTACLAGGQSGRVAQWDGSVWTLAPDLRLPAAPVLVSCSATAGCLALSADGFASHE
jgi:hypothetical protein